MYLQSFKVTTTEKNPLSVVERSRLEERMRKTTTHGQDTHLIRKHLYIGPNVVQTDGETERQYPLMEI